MKTIAAVLVVWLGCATDPPSVHDTVTCSPAWGALPFGIDQCERACQSVPVNEADVGQSPPKCVGANARAPGYNMMCGSTFTFEGVTGCCEDSYTLVRTNVVAFFVCP